MKILQIISKNFKVLLRSKSSALVVILGPLLLIMLVGLSFSNSSKFTLNVGVYSPQFNELTNSYIDKIAKSNDNYKIKKFTSEQECVDNIKKTAIHICIIFPNDFEIKNGKTNQIKFYIDQSKQNFVYAVVSTVESSFSERSNELSLDMTSKIIGVVTRTKVNIDNAKNTDIPNTLKSTNDILTSSKKAQDKLNGNSVDTNIVTGSSGDIDKKADALRNRITEQYAAGKDLMNLTNSILTDSTITYTNSTIESQYKTDAKAYDKNSGSLYQTWNNSITAKNDFINSTSQLRSSVTTLVKGIQDSKEKENEVVAELQNGLDKKVVETQAGLTTTVNTLNKVSDDINTLQVTSAENIVAPVITQIETVVPEKTHLDYLFPSLIVLLIMMMSILLSSTLIIMEKSSKAYFRNFTTPTSDFTFILSTFLTSLSIILVQILLVLGISSYMFKTNLNVGFGALFGIILLIASIFVLIGMIIGYLFNTEQTGMMGAISVSSIFLLTSDLILPMENMPIYLQKFAHFNPFVVSAEVLKKLIIFATNISNLTEELKVLGAMIAILLIAIVLVENFAKISFFRRFALYRKKPTDRPENIKEIFRLNGELVKNQKELYQCIKSMKRRDFKSLVYKRTNRVADFANEILNDKDLSEKVSKLRTRWGILKAIEKHNLISKDIKEVKKEKIQEQK